MIQLHRRIVCAARKGGAELTLASLGAEGRPSSPLRRAMCAPVLTLALLLLSSCSSLWNLGNRTALQADVQALLQADSLDRLSLDCRMIGSTRSAYCLGEIQTEQAQAAAQALGLTATQVDLDGPATGLPMASEGLQGCLDPEVYPEVDGLPAWWINGRPDQLALESGGQFEYLLLVVNPASGQGCVQVSYAYG